ncbi:MAG: helix-turn-helix domain-containing protein [Pseudomonadota bacterium]|nr:helix-turn-helix domain-containing protein [Pseudomonadota bacterium]
MTDALPNTLSFAPFSTDARERFRANLARIMGARGKTQAGLAREMTVSRVAVHAWMRGACFPETARLVQLAQTLNVTIGALLDGDAPSQEETMLLTAFRKLPDEERLALLAQVYARQPRSAGERAEAG